MGKKLKVLLLFDCPYLTSRGYGFKKEFREDDWSAENEVYRALKKNGYEVSLLGLYKDISVLLEEIKETLPDKDKVLCLKCDVTRQEDLENLVKIAHRKFFFRAGYIVNHIRHLNNWTRIRREFYSFIQVLKMIVGK